MKYVAKVNLKYRGQVISKGEEHPEPNKGLIDSGFIEAVEDAADPAPQNPDAPSGDAEPLVEHNEEPAPHDADAEPAPAAADERPLSKKELKKQRLEQQREARG